MPIKNYERFEEAFFIDGQFNQKVFEAYWDDDQPMEDDDNEYQHDFQDAEDTEEEWGSETNMADMINYDKLSLLGLHEHQDIVRRCAEWFEKQIGAGSYGGTIVPPLDTIRDYIIGMIGVDYKQYIDEDDLDNLSRFIYQEIDNYVFD